MVSHGCSAFIPTRVKTVQRVNRKATVAFRTMNLIIILGTTVTPIAGKYSEAGQLAASAKSADLFAAVRTVTDGTRWNP